MLDRSKENKGITLIALVITIIVLLILAGIAISMLSGENGILNQAAKAREDTNTKSTEEAIKLAVTAAMTNKNHSVDQTELEKELTNAFGINGYKIEVYETNEWEIDVNGDKYIVSKGGKTKKASQTIPVSDYGAEVTNYEVKEAKYKDPDMKWRIFLEDGKNIYLIAKDYMKIDYAPQSKGGHDLYKNGDYKLSMDNIYSDYTGSKDIINNAKFASTLDTYYKWAKAHDEGANINIRSVAYILDTDTWSGYAGDNAEYAIGAPTLEMFCASYNKLHTNKKIECDETQSDNGYKIKWSNSESYGTAISGLNTTEKDNLWVIDSSSKAYAMWLASPFSGNVKDLLGVSCNGFVSYNLYGNNCPGFRPLICLKSEVKLKKQSNGTYKIQTKN